MCSKVVCIVVGVIVGVLALLGLLFGLLTYYGVFSYTGKHLKDFFL